MEEYSKDIEHMLLELYKNVFAGNESSLIAEGREGEWTFVGEQEIATGPTYFSPELSDVCISAFEKYRNDTYLIQRIGTASRLQAEEPFVVFVPYSNP